MFGWIIVLLIVAGMAYVRLAPSDPAVWHKAATRDRMGEMPSAKGYLWREVVDGSGEAALAELDAVAMKTPRTQRLAGSVAEGQITYITRSQVFGFPDYTTVGVYGAPDNRFLEIYGRLRFGRSDLGVNGNRIKAWRTALEG